jgi:uncharacterized protein with GYD domain
MPTYYVLGRYTQQGMRDIKGAPQRIADARRMAQGSGVEMTSFQLTLGRYDFVAVIQAPDDETLARYVLATAARGNVTTETLRAFSEEETGKIISGLP